MDVPERGGVVGVARVAAGAIAGRLILQRYLTAETQRSQRKNLKKLNI
jgi:hypothetical protein